MIEAVVELLVGKVGQEIEQLAGSWLVRIEGHSITADGRIGHLYKIEAEYSMPQPLLVDERICLSHCYCLPCLNRVFGRGSWYLH